MWVTLHFFPVTLSPGHFVPGHFAARLFCTRSFCFQSFGPPITLYPCHFVPGYFASNHFVPSLVNFLTLLEALKTLGPVMKSCHSRTPMNCIEANDTWMLAAWHDTFLQVQTYA
jgi:hypothetical protein